MTRDSYLREKQNESFVRWISNEYEEARDLGKFAHEKYNLAEELAAVALARTLDPTHTLERKAFWRSLFEGCDARATALKQVIEALPKQLSNNIAYRNASYSRGLEIYRRDFVEG